MNFVFRNLLDASAEVRVGVAHSVEVESRLRAFDTEAETKTPRQEQGALYARATYLKYKSALSEFSAVASNLADWSRRRSVSEQYRSETLLLLEAFVTGDTRVAGALLLRSAWNNDVIIDFLVVNQEVTQARVPRLEGLGVLLSYSAFCIGEATEAPMVYVETASHTKHYWPCVCRGGTQLIRIEKTAVAAGNAATILRQANWRPIIEH